MSFEIIKELLLDNERPAAELHSRLADLFDLVRRRIS